MKGGRRVLRVKGAAKTLLKSKKKEVAEMKRISKSRERRKICMMF